MISLATGITYVLLLLILSASVAAEQKAYLKSAHRNSVNPGFSKGDCPVSPNNDPYGWHFILKGNTASFTSINCTFQLAGTVTEMIQQPSNKHAYVFTPTSDTLLDAWAMVDGSETEFVLSHVCSPSGSSASVTTTTTKLSKFVSFRGLLVETISIPSSLRHDPSIRHVDHETIGRCIVHNKRSRKRKQ